MKRSLIVAVLLLTSVAAADGHAQDAMLPLVGTDTHGIAHHQPEDWPTAAGAWNGKAARYNVVTHQLVFETYRQDIIGGSVATGRSDIPGVRGYYQAGPHSGSDGASGTTVLYIAGADGSRPRCIGCTDVVDGRDGVRIFQVQPSAGDRPSVPLRKTGFTVYANQNKDLATWYPDGQWIFAGVEMPRHALKHDLGNSEVGMFNDLWAISADGKTWVQLTDFAHTWKFVDATVSMPFPSSDRSHCPTGAQYANVKLFTRQQVPYSAYACSATQQPPPALGTMRPTVGNASSASRVPIAWGERVGLDPHYTWAGPLQLAMAQIAFVGGLPALADYRRNLTPTPHHPQGIDLWSNPNGNTQIGCGYEPWAFSRDNSRLGLASDVFLSSSSPEVKPVEMPYSQAFTDVVVWQWQGQPQLQDVTAYSVLYPYQNNGAPGEFKYYGHWEEPMVFSLGAGPETIAFGSSANLDPAWNPMDSKATFGLETWILRSDGSKPALQLTHFNGGRDDRKLAYPTATDPADNNLYITVVPGGQPGANPPGAIYKISAPPL